MSGGTERTGPTGTAPRRGRSPLAVASVAAAAVLLVGGGGAYLATAAPDDGKERGRTSPAADVPPPPLVLDGHGGTAGEDTAAGIAPGEPDPSGVEYVARGVLPKGPGRAPVYRAGDEVDAGRVTRLARALGLKGEPRAVGAVWKVGPDKGRPGAALEVERQAPGTWSFGDFGGAVDGTTGDDCLKGKICDPSGGGTPEGSSVPGSGQGTGGDPVDEAAARTAAAPVLEAAGQGGAALDASQVTGSVRSVNADPVVGGLPTYGWATGVQVGPDGRVTGASGRLAAPERDAVYPVIGADQALKLLNRPAQGAPPSIGGCATPVPAGKDGGPAVEKDPLKGDVACEPAKPAPTQKVTVERAVFGLAAAASSGRPVLVPSWLFEVRAGYDGRPFTITYPAVDPEHLAPPESATPAPSGSPDPGAREPGSEEPAPRQPGSSPRVESFAADGKTLTARFWGGVCSTFTLRAEETAERVALTVGEKPSSPGRACIAIAEEQTVEVALKEPLGDRRVVDARSGERVERR
ncbi:hypothetical protein [Streptomyces sp. NPDC047097]|uniref:hypothetical protein n=1 Tax=Streptomyces sp. NPDC047097 TaxID=3155260 RepID=UPI0033C3E0F8